MDNRTPHGGQVHRLARRLQCLPQDITDFSANINPLGPPDSIQKALALGLQELQYYPDATQHAMKRALGQHLSLAPGSILVGNGAAELIDMTMRFRRPQRVIVLDPAFGEYRAAARRNQIPFIGIPLSESFDVPWTQILATARPGDLVIWNNPHNPSGTVQSRDKFDDPIHILCQRGVFLMIDESFIDFLPHPNEVSALSLAEPRGSLVTIVRSLTKYYAIPGLRVGYAVADRDWIREVEAIRDGWSVNHLAQVATIAGLGDTDFATRTQAWLRQSHAQVEMLWANDPHYVRYPSQINFFLLRWTHPEISTRLAQALADQGILVRQADDFIGLGPIFWRIAMRTLDENERLYQAVTSMLKR